MKTRFPLLAPVFAAGFLFSQSSCSRSEAQTIVPGQGPRPATPAVGAKASIKLYRENESGVSLSSPELSGTLISMEGDWVGLKEGSQEHWVPKARVLELRISR